MGMPGRNMCNFLLFFNFAMWLIDTFQLQNGKSGAVEAEVYGLESWVLIQRMTVGLVDKYSNFPPLIQFNLIYRVTSQVVS